MTEIQRLNEFRKIAPSLVSENEKMILWLSDNGFFRAPASRKYHGAYAGGLYDHSKAVCAALIDLTHGLHLKWSRPESTFIIGMFHDLCKIDLYKEVEETISTAAVLDSITEERRTHYEFNDEIVKGHGDKSVMYLSHLMRLTEEEMYCIRFHMGAFEKEDIESYSKAVEKFSNVLFTHTADMIASKIKGI